MFNKIYFLLCLFIIVFSSFSHAQDTDPNCGLIPAPVSIKKLTGQFAINQQTVFLTDSLNNKAIDFLCDYLQKNFGLKIEVKINNAQATQNAIVFSSKDLDSLPAEGYRLNISPQQAQIKARGTGLFYAVQTLIQLLPADKARGDGINLPALQIEDYPRFAYRGLMLDVSRHFFSVEEVKKIIDLLAVYKLNTFHWHLTDDQGWRMEIKKYPKLTEIGSRRAQTVIGNYHDRTPQQYDNTPVGGFYTQDQVRDVVKYASDRYVNIVPEIEMPGHSEAVLAAYPELSCDTTYPYKVAETWGVFHNIYCPSDLTFNFLQDVLTEVMDLFPGKFIHVGGDEVPKDAWKKSEFCQKLIKHLKLKDDKASSKEDKLQSYFIQRIEKFVNAKGRSIIGWDEILEGGLSPNATVMSWRGEAGGIAAAQQNHQVIMTPGSGGLYIDQLQGKREEEPLSIGGFDPLSKIYSYNPTPAILTPAQQKFVLGVQANLWTEYIPTNNKVEYMLLPRLMALAEVGWTPLANKNYTDFANTRLPGHLAWLDKNNYDYHVPPAIGTQDTIMFGGSLNVNLTSPVKGAKVFYTIDGYTPRETDIEYTNPICYDVPPDQYRELKTVVITPAGHRSRITHAIVYNKQPLAPVIYTGTAKGLKYQLITGDFTSVSQLATSTGTIDTGVVTSFNVTPFKKNMKGFGIIYNGYIQIAADGNYGFSTSSANGSVLLIDDLPVVDNDGKHGVFDQGGTIPLLKGYHKITVKYFDNGGTGTLKVFTVLPDKTKAELVPDTLFN